MKDNLYGKFQKTYQDVCWELDNDHCWYQPPDCAYEIVPTDVSAKKKSIFGLAFTWTDLFGIQ